MKKYHEILKKYWGYDEFRPLQEEIISNIVKGKDTLGLMPTGGGKSLTFQVPALAMEGVCLVITPLIALMKDQVQNLRNKGIKAVAIYTGMKKDEIEIALNKCLFGGYKFLYVSPERLESELFKRKLKSIKISIITVDESHCISQWGYDFRPAYLKIADIRTLVPHAPILALTATATPRVVKDIQEKLQFKEENALKMSFERKNLAYVVRECEDKSNELISILKKTTGSAIVYVRNRKKTKETAQLLLNNDITATHYHAGLTNAEKDQKQEQWQNNSIRVMVATNAFGMGIDKPDVRFVIHIDLPDSIEAYFQEAGRAGRDQKKAYAIMLFGKPDLAQIEKRAKESFPEIEYIRSVYNSLQYYYQMAMDDGMGCKKEFNMTRFCQKFKFFPVPVNSALKILTQTGCIEYIHQEYIASRVMILINKEELYRINFKDKAKEDVIQALLRSYTGLFSDFVYINETDLELFTQIHPYRIYSILMDLTKQGIIKYIPNKNSPYIIYTKNRIDPKYIKFTDDIYKNQKERYVNRIKAMKHYVTNVNICRSRFLLHYFGEQNDHNCGQCDICIKRKKRGINNASFDEIRDYLLKSIQENEVTSPATLIQKCQLDYDKEEVTSVLRFLMDEEIVSLINGKLRYNE